MAEYIEREQALDVINLADFIADEHGLLLYADSVQACLLDIPAADVKPVVRGEWIWTETGDEDYEQFWACSVCGEHNFYEANFCPNCGADMRGENDG